MRLVDHTGRRTKKTHTVSVDLIMMLRTAGLVGDQYISEPNKFELIVDLGVLNASAKCDNALLGDNHRDTAVTTTEAYIGNDKMCPHRYSHSSMFDITLVYSKPFAISPYIMLFNQVFRVRIVIDIWYIYIRHTCFTLNNSDGKTRVF